MSSKRKKISKGKKIVFTLELIALIAILVYLGKSKIEDVVVEKAADTIVETVITDQAKKMGASDAEVQQVLEQVTEEDKQVVEEIVINHMDSDVISKGTEYLESGDIEGLKQYASETLSPEEIDELMELYDKYK